MRRGPTQKIGNFTVGDWIAGGFVRRVHFRRARIGTWCKRLLSRRRRHARLPSQESEYGLTEPAEVLLPPARSGGAARLHAVVAADRGGEPGRSDDMADSGAHGNHVPAGGEPAAEEHDPADSADGDAAHPGAAT